MKRFRDMYFKTINSLETNSTEQKPEIYTEAYMIWDGLLIPNKLSEEWAWRFSQTFTKELFLSATE